MSLLGLDIGTTGCKAVLFDLEGRVLGQGAREYEIHVPRPGWAEQDAEHVWKLAWDALGEAVAAAPRDPPLALALSVQGEAVIPVDGDGRALRPAILGMDTRTAAENQWLEAQFGAHALFRRTGMPIHTINTLPKLLWLRWHEPETYQSAHQFLLYEDFLLRRLDGQARISHCLASRTQMYDQAAGDWADDILGACDIDRERLAPLASPAGGVIGTLRPDLARALGLERQVLLVSGGHDQACAALGGGVLHAGQAMVSTGTAEVLEVACPDLFAPHAFSQVRLDDLGQSNISLYRHVVPGLYLAMTLNHSGGLLLRWFRDALCRWEREQAQVTGQDPYDLLLSDLPAGPTRLLVLPHFAGSGTPWLDTASKGAILGLTFATTQAEIVKALLEGLTFELRISLDLLREAGLAVDELRAVGGGARSPLWLQLKADICQVPLRVPRVTNAACLGAALLAGVAAGVYPGLAAAVEQAVHVQERVAPQAGSVSAYDRRYQLYRQVYPALGPLLRQL
jgi:xylulokinase